MATTIRPKLDRIVRLFAQKNSARQVELITHTDRHNLKKWFLLNKNLTIKSFSLDYAKKVAEDVLKYNLTYDDVKKKYGSKGLISLYYYKFKESLITNNKIASKVFQLRKKGLSFFKIGSLLDKKPSSIQRSLYQKYGEKSYMGHVRLINIEKRNMKLRKDFESGYKPKELAVKYNIALRSVYRILNNLGLVSRKPSVAKIYYDRIKKLREANFSWKDIVYILDTSLTPQSLRSSFENETIRRAKLCQKL